MIFGIITTRDISKLSQITSNNFEISLVVFMQNITTNHAITYTNIIFWSTLCGFLLFFSGLFDKIRHIQLLLEKSFPPAQVRFQSHP